MIVGRSPKPESAAVTVRPSPPNDLKEACRMNHKGLRILCALVAMTLILSVCFSALAYETIPFGSEGSQVTALQRALKSKGYYKGTVDGKFGQKTRSAIYRYQKAIGISTDGRAGNMTLTALYDGVAAANAIQKKKTTDIVTKDPKTLYYGCTGDEVKNLQRLLKKAGYYKGSVDGTFGDILIMAVKRFQWAKGLRGDGLVGTKTMEVLKDAVAK
jgi:peptidoglycan hydrolase-like protein with peptidoglycan-binding domain